MTTLPTPIASSLPAPVARSLPHVLLPHQWEAVSSDRRSTLLSGGFGSGKTIAAIYRMLYLSFALPYPVRGVYGMYTVPQLDRVFWPEFLDIVGRLPSGAVEIHNRKGIVYIRRSPEHVSTWFVTPFDVPEKLQGPTLHAVIADELTVGVTESTFRVLMSRLRAREGGSFFGACNPGSIRSWVYRAFTGQSILEPDDVTFIKSGMADNPYLPMEYVRQFRRYPRKYKLRYVMGEWGSIEGAIYAEFDPDVHVVTRSLTDDCTLYRSVDFGYTNPFCCLWFAVYPDGFVYVVREHYAAKVLIPDHAEAIRRIDAELGLPIEATYCDSAGASDRALLESELGEAFQAPPKADKSEAIRRLTVPAFIVDPDKGPGIGIHPACSSLLSELPAYQWKADVDTVDSERATGSEVPHEVHNHAMDCLLMFYRGQEQAASVPSGRISWSVRL